MCRVGRSGDVACDFLDPRDETAGESVQCQAAFLLGVFLHLTLAVVSSQRTHVLAKHPERPCHGADLIAPLAAADIALGIAAGQLLHRAAHRA
jgi:hypothetical protein